MENISWYYPAYLVLNNKSSFLITRLWFHLFDKELYAILENCNSLDYIFVSGINQT